MEPSALLDTQSQQLMQLNFNYWFLQTLAMLATAIVLPGLKVSGIFSAFFAVVALAFVNSKVWSAMLFFRIPDSVSTEALVLLATNGLIFWVIVKLLPGIEIRGVFTAIAAPVTFTVCSLFISQYLQDVNWIEVLGQVIEILKSLKTELEQHFPDAVSPPATAPPQSP